MPGRRIERELPGAGQLSATELQAISDKSVGILCDLGPEIQWVELTTSCTASKTQSRRISTRSTRAVAAFP